MLGDGGKTVKGGGEGGKGEAFFIKCDFLQEAFIYLFYFIFIPEAFFLAGLFVGWPPA